MEEMITITLKEYQTLIKDQIKLDCLEGCGVDNWQGWDDAMDMMREMMSKKEDNNE